MRGLHVKLTFLPPAKGGRTPPPSFSGGLYRPHFRVGAEGEYLGVAFLDGPEHAAPDTEIEVAVALIYDVDYSVLQPSIEFEVFEGGRCVATGRVIQSFDDDRNWHTVAQDSA